MRLRLLGTVTGLCLLVGLSVCVKVSAASISQPGFNVITSPLPIKITTSPGQTVTTELRIKNQGIAPEGIKVGLLKFGASGSNGTPDLYHLTSKDTFVSWVTFTPQTFIAQPGIWDSVQMTINVPKSAGLGYYLAVTFSPTVAGEGTGVTNLNGEVATLILLNVQVPNEEAKINLLSFQTDHGLYEYLPATFNIKVHNSGNIFIAPVGNIFVQKADKTVDVLDVNDAGGSVLPGTNRVFNVPWSDGFPVYVERLVNGKPVEGSNGIPEENLKWDFTQASKLRFGRYTANLLLVYNNGTNDVPEQATVSFWVLPWKILVVLVLIVLLLGYGVFSLIRPIVRRARGEKSKFTSHGKKK